MNETTGGATPEQLQALRAPFHDILERSESGRTYRWVDAPRVMDRFDDAVGAENWRADYAVNIDYKGVVCTISILIEGRGWVSRSNGGGFGKWVVTKKVDVKDEHGRSMKDADGKYLKEEIEVDNTANAWKAGFTDSFRRAAMAWGVAREQYLNVTNLPKSNGPRPSPAPASDRPAGLPHSSDHPRNRERERERQADAAPPPARDYDGPERPPTTGSQLYAWANRNGAIDWVVAWGERHGTKKRVVDWSNEAAERAFRAFQEEHSESLVN